ncbi:MAG: NifU-like terminal protein [Rhodospirillales bacterium]|nr:NifU-like terminal protein [Rhodospirillales bacterium]
MEGGCCGTTPRRSVSDYLDRGLRRNRAGLRAVRGVVCRDRNDLSAHFSGDLVADTIRSIGFKVSPCATLLAYCEMLAELATGRSPTAAWNLTAADLAASLPEVPPPKRDRAILAVAALHSLLLHADQLAIAGETP